MIELYPFLHVELGVSGAFNQKTATTVISDNGFDNLVNHLQPSICQLQELKKGKRFCGVYCECLRPSFFNVL